MSLAVGSSTAEDMDRMVKRKNIFLKLLGAVVRPMKQTSKQRTQNVLGIDQRHRLVKRKLSKRMHVRVRHDGVPQQQSALKSARLRAKQKMQSTESLQTDFGQRESIQNIRLAQLLNGMDASTSGSELDSDNAKASMLAVLGPLSPILMQQRFEELEHSYRHCQLQLSSKDKQIKFLKLEKSQIQSKYNRLFDEYCNEQRRFEDVCKRYLRLQTMKREEVNKLKDALGHACDCVVSAQNALNLSESKEGQQVREFKQNLQSFITSMQLC